MRRRIFFDVTYTRIQLGNVGITRTVRSLLAALQCEDAGASQCIPVIFHSSGFRVAPVESAAPGATRKAGGALSGTFRWLMSSRLRRVITDLLPLRVLNAAWVAYNSITFDALSRAAPPVRFERNDVVVLCDASWNYRVWLAARDARSRGAKVVLVIHDLIPLRHPEFCAPLFTLTFREWLREMISCSDAIICNSASTKQDLEAFSAMTRWNLPPVGHFRLGCDLDMTEGTGETRGGLAAMTGGPDPCFLAVGSIEPRKNHAILLAAFDRLWAQGSNVRLLVIGRPTPDCAELVDAMKTHPECGKRLLPVFDATDKELQYAYANCKALIFPSLAEGFGLPLVEARTRGCIVIASDIPVFRELADEGVLIFERNSLEQLCARILSQTQSDVNTPVRPMAPFTWKDSAAAFRACADNLLASGE